jgi:hypothetical protein
MNIDAMKKAGVQILRGPELNISLLSDLRLC